MQEISFPRRLKLRPFWLFVIGAISAVSLATAGQHEEKVLTGKSAFTDAAHESPGVRRHLTAADLPAPDPAESERAAVRL